MGAAGGEVRDSGGMMLARCSSSSTTAGAGGLGMSPAACARSAEPVLSEWKTRKGRTDLSACASWRYLLGCRRTARCCRLGEQGPVRRGFATALTGSLGVGRRSWTRTTRTAKGARTDGRANGFQGHRRETEKEQNAEQNAQDEKLQMSTAHLTGSAEHWE